MAHLSVVSWNIEMGYRPDLAARELREMVALQGADLVLLQEVDHPGSARIADALGMHFGHAAAAAHPRTGRPFGNTVLSREPIVAVDEIELPHTAVVAGQPRSGLRVHTTVAGRRVVAYSVHTETALLPLAKRRQQFRTVARDVTDQSAHDLVVVGGDFNTVTGRGIRSLHTAMRSAGLEPANLDDHPTFVRMRRSMRLDHVYARGMQVRRSGVVSSTTASDHFPLWVHFDLV